MIRRALIVITMLSVPAFAQLIPIGREMLPPGGPSSVPVIIPINTDNDTWESAYPPGIWHTVTIPGIPETTVAIQLDAILAISMGYWEGIADLMITFRPVGAPEPLYWTWQTVAVAYRVTAIGGGTILVADCPRSNATAIVPVINRKIQFKWIKRVNYINRGASGPNWPNFPSMGAGTYWSKLWLAP